MLTIDAKAFTMSYNDTTILAETYILKAITSGDHSATYEMEFTNGRTSTATIENDQLTIIYDMFNSGVYKRIR